MHISSLEDHILETIFDLNADMSITVEKNRNGTITHDDFVLNEIKPASAVVLPLGQRTRFHALTTTLRTTHVCREWRQLMVRPSQWSAKLWGRLLDLDVLSEAHLELRQEIFKRAGDTALLSVKGTNLDYNSPTADFAIWLVREHWGRLEWVDVSVNTYTRLTASEARFWRKIATPTKNLRRFYFEFSTPLLANPQGLTSEAPGLREFHSTLSSPLHLNSPWVSQLTYLSIDGMGQPDLLLFDLPDFLDALRSMRSLEALEIRNTRLAEGNFGDHPRKIELARLRSLTLKDEFNTCFSILRHVSPSRQCRLDIHAQFPRSVPSEEYWNFDNWMEKYLPKRTYNDRILIDLQPYYGEFVDAYPDCYPAPTTRIRVDYTPGYDQPDAQSLFGFLPRQKFDHAKHVWFRMNLPINGEDFIDFIHVHDDLHFCLESAEVFKTTLKGFRLLSMTTSSASMSREGIIPLPRLQRIRIIRDEEDAGIHYIDPDEEPFVNEFIQFFRQRRQMRKPVQHLDIRGFMGDFTNLELCTGLRVTWKDKQYRNNGAGEYICGSGGDDHDILDIESDGEYDEYEGEHDEEEEEITDTDEEEEDFMQTDQD